MVVPGISIIHQLTMSCAQMVEYIYHIVKHPPKLPIRNVWYTYFVGEITSVSKVITRAVPRLVWPSIRLQSARGRVATAAAMKRHVRKTA